MQNGDNEHNSPNNDTTPYMLSNIEDNEWHDVQIRWSAAQRNLHVRTVRGIVITGLYNFPKDIVKTIFNDNPFVYWGFTGGTWAVANEQR
jgi:hypothetical protein